MTAPARRRVARLLAPCLLCLAIDAPARDWYSAGHGRVETRVLVLQEDEQRVRELLPAPLALNAEFAGKQPGRHPLVLLFSDVMPRKAHLMPILIDIPYREFALFIPEVTHPDLQGVFIHSAILYLDSRPAVWIGQWPYRFPKHLARIERNEGTGIGAWAIHDDERREPVLRFDYTLAGSDDGPAAQAALQQLDAWFALPLINRRNGKFACARMDWEISTAEPPTPLQGRLQWRQDWLGDARRLPAPAGESGGWRLQTLWYLSMPSRCGRYSRR